MQPECQAVDQVTVVHRQSAPTLCCLPVLFRAARSADNERLLLGWLYALKAAHMSELPLCHAMFQADCARHWCHPHCNIAEADLHAHFRGRAHL